MPRYYEAYNDRYLQVHEEGLQWSENAPTSIVRKLLNTFAPGAAHILEIGCGEGRDAIPLLRAGYPLLATDISPEAIRWCREHCPEHSGSFAVLDCINGQLEEKFDYIYAVSVLHMLVEDADRMAFYRFIRTHLKPTGAALICTMGDGEAEVRSDPADAFHLRERVHQGSGRVLHIAATTCRMVTFPAFERELADSGLEILEKGIAQNEPGFSELMYAVVKQK